MRCFTALFLSSLLLITTALTGCNTVSDTSNNNNPVSKEIADISPIEAGKNSLRQQPSLKPSRCGSIRQGIKPKSR